MSNITINNRTTPDPITCMGEFAGVCWGADTTNKDLNYKRGLDCLESNHGRTLEFPQVYLIIDDYSARVIREYMRHIGGAPSFLQESTRYVDCSKFNDVIPPKILDNNEAVNIWNNTMDFIRDSYSKLIELKIPKEDAAGILPLNMETLLVVRTNVRQLIDMSGQRLCNRAYHEFRKLMHDLMDALSKYSDEWKFIVDNYFKPKCEVLGYCPEKRGCGRVTKRIKNDSNSAIKQPDA